MDVHQEIAVEPDQMDVGNIFRSIFNSCDIENTDSVRVSELIEFIKPYLMEDLNALEDLRHSLDPEGTNICVNSQRFYEVIGQWSQKLGTASSSEETEFDKSPSLLTVMDDNNSLPYVHSTPRASLGDKLLKCKDLLNLSNVSGYSLSTSRLDHPETDRTILEEEIKKLQYQLQKTSDELFLTKQQLTIVEEQNEQLQQDLVRINRRLHEEQQVNKHLQKDLVMGEDLRDELGNYKKCLEDLKKKLSQSEKDGLYQKDYINELNEEKTQLEKKTETLSKRFQDCSKELSDVKIELQTKDAEIIRAIRDYNELKREFSEQKDFIDQLREENELLNHQKLTLEKTLKVKLSSSPQISLGNFPLELTTSSPKSHISQTPYQNKSQITYKPVPLLKKVLSRQNSAPGLSGESSSDDSPPNAISRIPVLNTNRRDSFENTNQRQDSSDEDLSWKLQMGMQNTSDSMDFDRTTESLRAEMNKADYAVTNEETYNTVLFEKDELIVELECEIQNQKAVLKKLEEELNESTIKEGRAQSEIETLKQRLGQLEQNDCKITIDTTADEEIIQFEGTKLELEESEENLEKQLITEFENKVKYSIEAEESILNLTQKCKKLQEELSNLSKTVINKNKSLLNAENQLVLLTDRNTQLQKEIDALNESKIELELKIVKIRTEHGQSLSKINNIDMMATEIQNYIQEKNDIIKELKQLNRKLEVNLKEAQLNLNKQIEDTMELRNELIKSLGVKNKLWKNTCSLEADCQAQISKINQISESYQILLNSNEELNKDYNNLLVVYDIEVDKSCKLALQVDKCKAENDELKLKLIEEITEKQNLKSMINDLEVTNREISVQKSKASQTVFEFEEEFSKAEEESKQLLDELLIKFNKEVDKNRSLTNELIDLKNNYTKNNAELSEIKRKLADNEVAMHNKLEENCQKFEEMNQEKDNKINQIENELKQNKFTLEKAEKTNLLLNRELKEIEKKCSSLMEELNRAKEHLHQKNLKINEIESELNKLIQNQKSNKSELTKLKIQLENLQQENNQLQQELTEKNEQIKNIQASNIKLQNDTKQEKEALNRELANLKKSFSTTEKTKSDRLQEEICKNKALFEHFCALKNERDQLRFNLEETQVLLANIQALYNKKHNDLQELQNKYCSSKTQFEKAQKDMDSITNALIAEADKLKVSLIEKNDREANTDRSYFKQQIIVQKLKDKIEDLEGQLKIEKSRSKDSEQLIKEREASFDALQRRYEGVNCEMASLEEKLKIALQEVEDFKREQQAVRKMVDVAIQVQEYEDSGDTCEGKPLKKFTVTSRPESPDSPSPDLELINLANLKDYACSSKFVYNSQGDSILEVPSIDVQGFADDIINDLDLDDSSPRKKLEREELETTVTAMILQLVANSSNISSRIEKRTEEYRRQYEAILVLLNDISYRLRDHICIGTAEPIKPVYPLLEDIKQQLRGLVQNAGQVGLLVCEDRTKRCWNLVVNYVALLRQDNEALRNTSRATTPTQTGLMQRTKSVQEEADVTPIKSINPQSKGRSGRHTKLAVFLFFVIAFTIAFCLAIDLNCRMTASEYQYCPLDAIVQRINVGLLPM